MPELVACYGKPPLGHQLVLLAGGALPSALHTLYRGSPDQMAQT